MAQAKDLRNSIKNLEESHEQRIQNLQKANAALKTQIAGQGISRSPTKDSLVIEDLKSKIIALNREIKLQKDDFGQQVLKYEALLTDCKKNVEQISAGTPAFLHDIKKNLEGENEKHKEYIVELETKLEWHLKGHPIIQVKNDQYQIKGLKSDVIGKERSNQQSLEDVGRIKELEGQLLELQVDSVKSSAPLPDVNESLLSSRSAIENERIALKKECKKDIDLLAEKVSANLT